MSRLNLEINKLKSLKNIFDVNNAYKRIKSRKLSVKDLTLLKSISEWREKTAQKVNIPRNWVISDKVMLQFVKKKKLSLVTKDNKNKNFNSKIDDFKKFLEIEKLV